MSNKPSAGLPAWLALLVAPLFLLAALLFYRNVHSQLPPAEQETLLAPVGRLVVKDAAPAADNKAEAPPATAKKEAAKTEEKSATAPKAEKVEAKEEAKAEEKPAAEAKAEEKPATEAKAEEKKAEAKAEAQEGSASADAAKKADAAKADDSKSEEKPADAKKADEAKAEAKEEAKEEAKAEEKPAAEAKAEEKKAETKEESASADAAKADEPKTDAKADGAKGDAGCEATLLVGDDMSYNLAEITLDKAACPEFTVHLKHQGQMSASVMGHNVVISAAADKDAIVGAGADAGLEQNFVPASDPHVLAHTKILGGGEADSVRFSTDKFKAGGDYDFYCTYPGHASMMHGKVIVK